MSQVPEVLEAMLVSVVNEIRTAPTRQVATALVASAYDKILEWISNHPTHSLVGYIANCARYMKMNLEARAYPDEQAAAADSHAVPMVAWATTDGRVVAFVPCDRPERSRVVLEAYMKLRGFDYLTVSMLPWDVGAEVVIVTDGKVSSTAPLPRGD